MGSQGKRTDIVSEKNGVNSKVFIVGAVIGGLVGAATALFLAPKSGCDFRNNLNEQVGNLKSKGERLKSAACNKGSFLATSAKAKASSLSKSISKSNTTLNKVWDLREMKEEGSVTEYISIEPSISSYEEIHKKLQDTQKAFEDVEVKIKG